MTDEEFNAAPDVYQPRAHRPRNLAIRYVPGSYTSFGLLDELLEVTPSLMLPDMREIPVHIVQVLDTKGNDALLYGWNYNKQQWEKCK